MHRGVRQRRALRRPAVNGDDKTPLPVGALFTKEHWKQIGQELGKEAFGRTRRVAKAWWEEAQDELVGMAKAEADQVLKALREGDRGGAKLILAGNMNPGEWDAWVSSTNEALRDIANRRARLIELLEDLGRRAAIAVGTAALAALGL